MKRTVFNYAADEGLLLGFHGCDRQLAEKVILGKDMLRPSTNKYDWLGYGIYFWQNNYDRAYDYACKLAEAGRIEEPAVIGAVINLEYCLDLLDKKSIDVVKRSWGRFITSIGSHQLPQNVNPRQDSRNPDRLLRYLDCTVLESVHDIVARDNQQPHDTVRCAFIEGQPIYPGATFMDKSHIQICVRNPNCIKGLFMPRLLQPWNGKVLLQEPHPAAIAS